MVQPRLTAHGFLVDIGDFFISKSRSLKFMSWSNDSKALGTLLGQFSLGWNMICTVENGHEVPQRYSRRYTSRSDLTYIQESS